MNIIESEIVTKESKIAIVIARVNRFINQNLLEGSVDVLKRIGYVQDKNITIIWVPGAYELPLIAKALAMSNQYDAIIVLGTVIKGMTMHFEFIAQECSTSISNISIENMLPIGFGLLFVDDVHQAIERSGIKGSNKGKEVALSVLEMINILKIIKN